MPKQIQLPYDAATGLTSLYALVRKPDTDQVWSVSGTAWVTYVEANRANYKISLSEDVSGSRHYVANFPSSIAEGVYKIVAYLQAGGSPVGSDQVKGVEDRFEWSGTNVVALSALPAAFVNYDIGNGRTVAYFLQGGWNLTSFSANGEAVTLYGTDDVTPLKTGTATRFASSIGGLRSADPV